MTQRPEALRNVRRVAVVMKQTVIEDVTETQDERMLALLKIKHIAVAGAVVANDEHQETADNVVTFLRQKGLAVVVFERSDLPSVLEGFDLIITVGGDGTLLTAAAHILDTPVLGIRSAQSSLAHHCLADWSTFPCIITKILAGRLRPYRLLRLTGKLHRIIIKDGNAELSTTPTEFPILNDVLVHDKSPAGTSRYILKVNDKVESHDSSGLWLGTPAGSTGALRSAGGKYIPITAQKFEFITREPCIKPGKPPFSQLRVVLDRDDEVTIVSRMRNGRLYPDGQYRELAFEIGDEVRFSRSPHDLIAFVNPQINKRYDFYFGVYREW